MDLKWPVTYISIIPFFINMSDEPFLYYRNYSSVTSGTFRTFLVQILADKKKLC